MTTNEEFQFDIAKMKLDAAKIGALTAGITLAGVIFACGANYSKSDTGYRVQVQCDQETFDFIANQITSSSPDDPFGLLDHQNYSSPSDESDIIAVMGQIYQLVNTIFESENTNIAMDNYGVTIHVPLYDYASTIELNDYLVAREYMPDEAKQSKEVRKAILETKAEVFSNLYNTKNVTMRVDDDGLFLVLPWAGKVQIHYPIPDPPR